MVKIRVNKNGPILIEGDGVFVMLKDGQEEKLERKGIALCRCGASENKPFCDGSHRKINFQADEVEFQLK